MARSHVRQNEVNRFELQPHSGERSYDSLFFRITVLVHSQLGRYSQFALDVLEPS